MPRNATHGRQRDLESLASPCTAMPAPLDPGADRLETSPAGAPVLAAPSQGTDGTDVESASGSCPPPCVPDQDPPAAFASSGDTNSPSPQPPLPEKRRSPQESLSELLGAAELFHDPDGEAYAVLTTGVHGEVWAVRSRQFRRWLVRGCFKNTGRPPAAQALRETLWLAEARAQFDGRESAVHLRVAGDDSAVVLDLGDAAWRCVEVRPSGLNVLPCAPVRFRRTRGMLPLPVPEPGGRIEDLRGFLNLEGDDDWRLVVAWLTAALRPRGPYPVLVLAGEQGSAKSTTARVLRAVSDPSTVPLRAEPRELRDLVISARNSWLLALDNLSSLSVRLSDAIVRLATGGGFAARQLFTDADECLIQAMRPVLLNGIEDLATRGDLLERSLVLTLPRIHEGRRRTETAFWRDFDAARGRIFGAVLEALAGALRELPAVRIDRLPRMADFAAWGVALERALAWPTGSFLGAYERNREKSRALGMEASPLAGALLEVAAAQREWTGTAEELLDVLKAHVAPEVRRQREWPASPRALGNAIRRLAVDLRARGVETRFERSHGRRRIGISSGKAAIPSAPEAPSGTL